LCGLQAAVEQVKAFAGLTPEQLGVEAGNVVVVREQKPNARTEP
jgi:hypothetical protein